MPSPHGKHSPEDKEGRPVSAVYDPVADEHVVVTGKAGAQEAKVPEGADEALGMRTDEVIEGPLSATSRTLISLFREMLTIIRESD